MRDGELVRDAVIQVPGVGWSNLADSLAQLVTDAFIQQSRFNPQHNARWEQTLYDNLPRWLSQETEDNNLQLDIQTDSARYQASVSRASVVAQLRPFYRRITEHLRELEGHGATDGALLMTERMAALPGMRSSFDAMGALKQDTVSSDALVRACLRYQDQLLNGAGTVSFTTRLRPQSKAVTAAEQRNDQTDSPTHVMLDYRAWPLGKSLSLGLGSGSSETQFQFNGNAGRSLGEIARQAGHFSLNSRESGWFVNGHPAEPGHMLKTGDVLRFNEIEHPLQLIQVHDGQR
jgi:hypothetical protein